MKVLKRINYLRWKTWSAPTTMTVFIIICMTIVFSLESLGLFNKDRNLEIRRVTKIKLKNQVKTSNSDEILHFLKKLSESNKLESLIRTHEILFKSAKEQCNYNNDFVYNNLSYFNP